MITRWEYHCVVRPRASTSAELGELGRSGWECFSILPPSAHDPAVAHYFRRPVHHAAPPRMSPPPLKGGLAGRGPSLADLVACGRDATPIRIRRQGRRSATNRL